MRFADVPSMLDTHGPEAHRLAGVWWLMFAMAAGVYVVVAAMVVIAIVRGRGTGRRAHAEPKPPRLHEEAFIWVGGIAVPVVILAVLAVVTVTTTSGVRKPARDPLKIEVTGRRWFWDVRYPGTGVQTANEIHVPAGRTVEAVLESDDVIHSFWVPQLFGKLDMIPGQPNHFTFEASTAGTYRGLCAEFCGIQHARMDFLVIADPPATFDRWLTRHRSLAAATPTSDQAVRGRVVFERESCAGCHTIRGTSARGTVGPELTDFGSRHWIGAITVPNDPARLAAWISDSQRIKPGNLMPPLALDPSDRVAVVAYLEGLK
jgi:cytochrome c oxidase subunit 2